jgi:putative DNA primase/helicase
MVDTLPLNTRASCPDLTPRETGGLSRLKAASAAALKPACAAARAAFVDEMVAEAISRGADPDTARNSAEALSDRMLRPTAALVFADPGIGTKIAGDVLADPDTFVGKSLADPLEGPSYGTQTAKVLRRPSGEIFIHSFAHGGASYRFVPDKPVIQIVAGSIERAVDEAETALIKADRGLFQRDGRIVFVSYTPAKTSTGEDTASIQIVERMDHALVCDMAASATFMRFDKRSNAWVPTDPPIAIAKALREHGLGRLRLPVLSGVVTAPTMRVDGSILTEQGYDVETGLLYDARGVDFPAVPERPTQADAESAMASLDSLLAGFPLVADHDRSVALSAILTACVRRSLPSAPLHCFTAPAAGTGKGKLVDIACVIATGFKAAPLNTGSSEEEMEKRLAAKLLVGEPFISIDNVTRPLGGELLCSMLTQDKVSPRILGFSKAPPVSTGAFGTANGNNLEILGDLIRRSVRSQIDAKVEQPEDRSFASDPVVDAMAGRAAYVVAALTALRAYHVAGMPGKPKPLGSFDGWSDRVRGTLIWLGYADPVASMAEMRRSDPVREQVRGIMGEWGAAFQSRNVTIAEVIREATAVSEPEYGGRPEPANPSLRDALMDIAGRGGAINARALGAWLSSKLNTIVDGRQFARMGERRSVAVWALLDAGE